MWPSLEAGDPWVSGRDSWDTSLILDLVLLANLGQPRVQPPLLPLPGCTGGSYCRYRLGEGLRCMSLVCSMILWSYTTLAGWVQILSDLEYYWQHLEGIVTVLQQWLQQLRMKSNLAMECSPSQNILFLAQQHAISLAQFCVANLNCQMLKCVKCFINYFNVNHKITFTGVTLRKKDISGDGVSHV